jgi:hypothetical protein
VWTVTELRDRIASAIYNDNGFGWSKYMCEEAADAVIEALDLRIEDKYKTASGQKQLFGVSGFWEVDGD